MKKKDEKTIEVAKQEIIEADEMERTRDYQCFVPKTDIYERDGNIFITADMPGVNQESIDIRLEKNVLSINGFTAAKDFSGFDLVYSEYTPGDYQRSFQLSDEIDHDKISATIKNGQLVLRLPKAEVKTKKIPVLTG
jgi:HSP20 family molecular chaperone IbpA